MSISFQSLGTTIQDGISTYSSSVSDTLITELTPIFILGVTIYICLKGYMFMSGRAENSIPDTVISLMKIGLISYLFVNTGNFIKYGVNFIKGTQDFLLKALPSSSSTKPTEVWTILDNLWETIDKGSQALLDTYTALDGWDFGSCLLLVATIFIYLFMAAYLTFAALGVLIIATISLEIVLGFGPLFCGLLMFPLTRSWFDGWLKACMTYVFTMVIMAAVITLIIMLMSDQINDFSDNVHAIAENMDEGGYSKLLNNLFVILIVSFGLTTLVKQVPSIAAGIVGGVAMQAVGLGSMLSGIGSGAVKAATATTLGGAAAAKMVGMNNMAKSLANTAKYFGGRGLDGRTADAITKRAERAIKAANVSSNK